MRYARFLVGLASLSLLCSVVACDDDATYGRATLLSTQDPDAMGNAQLILDGTNLTVKLNVRGFDANTTHANHIHRNFCPPPVGPGPEGPIVIPLTDITVGADGSGSQTTTVDLNSLRTPVTDLTTGNYYVNVHIRSTAAGTGPGQTCGTVVF
jgi:hypothetical protein